MSIVERAMERAKQAKAQLTANGPVPAPPMNVKPRFAVKSAAEAPPVEAMPYVDPSPFPIENLDYFKLDMAAIRATGGLPAPECMQDSVDQLRRLKWPLLKAVQGRGGPKEALNNRLMVTSSLPHEGKTFMSLGISLTLAREKGMRVLLIDADVPINSTDLSRRHVVIKRASSGQHQIMDLESRNGVFVNGLKIHSATLHDGDSVQLGSILFVYHEGRAS